MQEQRKFKHANWDYYMDEVKRLAGRTKTDGEPISETNS